MGESRGERRHRLRAVALTGLAALSCAAVSSQAAYARALPEGRAYELVSPADKASGLVQFPAAMPPMQLPTQSIINTVTADGNAATYFSYAAFANPETGMVASYRSRRTADGWATTQWAPRTVTSHPTMESGPARVQGVSEDLSTAFLYTADDFDPLEQRGDYYNDIYALRPDGSVTWESRRNDDLPNTTPLASEMVVNSADGSTVVFRTEEPLVPEAAGLNAGHFATYVRRDGVTTLLSARRDGGVLSTCGANIIQGATLGPIPQNPISRDGRRIFMNVPARGASGTNCLASRRIFMRDDAGNLTELSATQRTVPDTARSATLAGATPDGAVAFIVSREALTDDALVDTSEKLYRYDVASGRLTLLSGERVVGGMILGSSDDGSVLYYVIGRTLKVLADGVATPLVTFNDFGAPAAGDRATRMTADGRYLLIATAENLTAFDSRGTVQIYRFDRERGVTPDCLSCPADGVSPAGDARLGGDGTGTGGDMPYYPLIRNISSDGRRVVFDTPEPLAAGDTNGTLDVYLWVDGVVHLISSGKGELPNVLFGASADGSDIFFATPESLVPQDFDNGDYDIYDARIGGGFASPPPRAPYCSEDQCQDTPSTAPGAPTVGSDGVFAPEDPAEPDPVDRRVTVSIGKISKAARTTFARRGSLTLTAKVSEGGLATATARAAVGGKQRVVARAEKTASRGGTLRLGLKLSRPARRQLARRGRLTVRISVSFTDARTQTARVVLTLPKRAGR